MKKSRYIAHLVRAFKSDNQWEKNQFIKFFPVPPPHIYKLMEDAGFSSENYRDSWPDLIAGLPSAAWSAKHFVQFMDDEVTLPRRFPIKIDFRQLDRLARITVVSRGSTVSLIRNLIQAQIDFKPAIIADVDFWKGALSTASAIATPMIVFGDSHSLVFRQTIQNIIKKPIIPINILCGGGSASGLPNVNSISGYGNLIKSAALAIQKAGRILGRHPVVLFTFGQVDMEFVYSFKRAKSESYTFDEGHFKQFFGQLAVDYAGWIKGLGLNVVGIVGINPPCIDDAYIYDAYLAQMETYMNGRIADVAPGDCFEAVAEKFRNLQFAKKLDRTEYHRAFNSALQSAAKSRDLLYLDCFERMISSDGCISADFASASDGVESRIGRTGKDIHVGGQFALGLKADVAKAAQTLAGRAS